MAKLSRPRMRHRLQNRRRIPTSLTSPAPALELQYRLLFELSPIPMYVFNEKTLRILDVNKAMVKQYGWSRREFLGMTAKDIRPAKDVPRLRAALKRLRRARLAFVGQWQHRRKDGSLFDADVSVSAVEFAGQPARLVLLTDITPRKQAEEALRKSEQRYRMAVDFTYDWEFWMDPQGHFAYISPSCERITGHKPAAFMADPSLRRRVIHPDDRFRLDRHVRDCERKRKPGRVEWRVRHPDGSWGWVEHVCQPVFDERGQYFGVRGSNRDITERKRAEEALRASADQLQLAQQAAGAGMWDWDIVSGKLTWSTQLFALFGLDPLETKGSFDAWRRLIHPDDRRVAEQRIWVAVRNRTPLDTEYRIMRPGGEVRWINARGNTHYDARGKPQRISGVCLDITGRKQAEAVLAHERDLLQSVMNSAGRAHLVYLDRDFNFVRVNDTYAATCGYRPEEMIGKNHFALYPNAENEAIFRRVRDTGKPFAVRDKPFKFPGQPERGVTYWDWTLIPVKDTDGQVTGLIFSLFETTARVQAEAALKRTSNTLAEAQRIAHLGSFEYVAATRTTVWSEEEYRIYCLDSSQPSPSYDVMLQKCIHPRDRALVSETFTKAMQSRSIYELEHRIVLPDGSVRCVYNRAHPYFDEQGKLVRYLGVTLDITARKEAEEKLQQLNETLEQRVAERTAALEESRTTLQGFYDSAPFHMGIAELDGDKTVVVSGNRAVAVFLKKRPADLTGKKGVELGAPKAIEHLWVANCRRSQREGVPIQFEYEYPRPAGKRWLRATVVFIGMGPSGNPRFSFVVEDITQHKHAEKALQESEERFRQMAENVPSVFWLADAKLSRMLYVSPAFEWIWGQPVARLYDNPVLWLEAVHPDDRTRVQQAFFNRRGAGGVLQAEYRIVRPDGSIRWVADHGAPVRDEVGRVYRMAGVVRDITEQKRLQAEVQNISEMERQRLGRDLHDGLCQHLTAMAMFSTSLATALERKGLTEAQQATQLAQRAREATAITHDLSRGLYPASLQLTGLSTALSELAALVQKMFPIRCQFHNSYGRRLPEPDLERQLYRIAQEAAFNAAKHSGGRHVWIGLRQSKHWLTLTVKDDGAGMDGAKAKPGDMGLNIMRYRAEHIGAQLTIDAKRGRGTTVTCKLRNHFA